MYRLLKPLLFLIPPELAHRLTLVVLELALAIPGLRYWLRRSFTLVDSRLRLRVLGLDFPNPVGLAAGFDKDGRHLAAMATLGFGFIEVGTVTPRPQSGNPTPRLFRLPADEALINRMGFNNAGVDALVEALRPWQQRDFIIGGNIGKNKDTPNEAAADDYLYCFERLHPYVDYFVVNVSSPNTPNLRALQDKEPLQQLLQVLQNKNAALEQPRPLLLKIAPDLTEAQLDDILDIVANTGIAGVVATNTTTGRSGLETAAAEVAAMGTGGLSGAPLRERATAVVRYLHEKSNGKLFIMGVGGIDSPTAAQEKWQAGATLVQVYTGLVYAGPGLVKRILRQRLANR